MDNNPLVSVILPTYNRANLVRKAVQSIIDQSCPHWELILWNDGSIDATEDVVNSIQDQRIKYFFAENHGKSWALNQAIKRSSGKYIAFLDDDDLWLPDKLTLQINILRQHQNVELVFGNFLNINKIKNTRDIGFSQNAKGLAQLNTKKIGKAIHLITAGWLPGIALENFIAFDTVTITRKTFDQLGRFNEFLKNGMDFEYWWRFGLAGMQAAYTEEVVLRRVKYPGSLSGVALKSLINHLKMLDACTALSRQAGRPETVRYLRPCYRNTWHNLIKAYGDQGDLPMAYAAFQKSNQYGFRLGGLRLLIQSLVTPKKGNIE